MNPQFSPGIPFCKAFYEQAVRPLLEKHFPNLVYSAALLGSGSEVLGYDTKMSSDHHWGPRVMLFVREEDIVQAPAIHDMLANNLPYSFRGYSTHFSEPDPNDSGVQHLEVLDSGPINHRVTVQTPRQLVAELLGFDLAEPLTAADWLSFPQQKLLTLTAGAVYHDGIGLEEIRARFAWYPRDVWLYLLAAAWTRIGQEEHLMGRAGFVGDEVGSALLGSRLARDVMNLCFLMEKKYAPYPKWFGTAFKRLDSGPELYPTLRNALSSRTWRAREKHLTIAYAHIARKHNQLGLTQPLPETPSHFFGRPFQVIAFHGFAEALLRQIRDPEVKKIAELPTIGSINQFSDNTDLLEPTGWREKIKNLYDTP